MVLLRHLNGLGDASRDLASGHLPGVPAHDDVRPAGQRVSDGLIGLPSHDDGASLGELPEMAELFGDVPRQPAVFPDDFPFFGHGHDNRNHAHTAHTAMSILMDG